MYLTTITLTLLSTLTSKATTTDDDDENLPSAFYNGGINDQYSPAKSSSFSMSNSNSQDGGDQDDADGVIHNGEIHRVYNDSESSIDENYYTRPNNGLNITNY